MANGELAHVQVSIPTGDTGAQVWGARWSSFSLSYSFTNSSLDYNDASPGNVGYSPYDQHLTHSTLSVKQQNAAHDWFDNYAAVSGLSFTQFTGVNDDDAVLRLANTNDSDVGTAMAYFPDADDWWHADIDAGATFREEANGDIWFNNTGDNPDKGDFDYATVGHEIGHALGLKHGHSTSGPSYSIGVAHHALTTDHNSQEYSIMTYQEYPGAPPDSTLYSVDLPQSLMMYDIAATQYLYGANYAHESGNTVYSWNTSTGEMSIDGTGQGAPISNRVFSTVWDGNGTDTYDFSSYTTDLNVDLTPGGYTDLDVGGNAQRALLSNNSSGGYAITYARGHVYNALLHNGDTRSLIENAYGGSGDDTMTGNQGNNGLKGAGGNDSLMGEGGNDVLKGGGGADSLRGGIGDDTMYGGDGDDNVYWESGTDAHYGGDGADWINGDNTNFGSGVHFNLDAGTYDNGSTFTEVYEGFEHYNNSGSASGAERVTGSGVANTIWTGGGANVINGLGGEDLLKGGGGNDTIDGGADDDTLKGGGGADSLIGGNGEDLLQGDDGNDTLAGGSGTDTVEGGAGDDLILFTSGHFRDNVDGGAGTDTLDATAQNNSGQVVNFLTGEITGYTAGGSTLSVANIEIYRDGSGDNTIHNSNVAGMQIYGGAGDDTIHAGNNAFETLDGGAGTDLLDTTRYNGSYAIDLAAGTTGFGESFLNFEDLNSGNGNDTVTGSAGANVLTTNGGNDVVNDGFGGDTVDMGAGDDRLVMGDASINGDTYEGGAGIDTFDASARTWATNVTIDLAAGVWSYFVGSEAVTGFENIEGAGGAIGTVETLTGDAGANVINGNGGDDLITGGAGDDTVSGGAGNDTLVGGTGAGDDSYDGGADTDTITFASATQGVTVDLGAGTASGAETGNDTIANVENVIGGSGNDTVTGSAGANVLTTDGGNDVVDDGGGGDTVDMGSGDDRLVMGDSSINGDTYEGGAGTDTFDASHYYWGLNVTIDLAAGVWSYSAGSEAVMGFENIEGAGGNTGTVETLTGDAGANVINGNGGTDSISGGAGDDTVSGGTGADTLNGGAGFDMASYSGASVGMIVRLDTGLGYRGEGIGDVLTSIEGLVGSAQGDTLIGNAEANRLEGAGGGDDLRGYDGDDTLQGGTGADKLNGGNGFDIADYSAASVGMIVRLDTGLGYRGESIGDVLTSIEGLIGSAEGDTLIGNAEANLLEGAGGDDSLRGYDGDDTLRGGTGADTLNGGNGFDTASYSLSAAGVTVDLAAGLGGAGAAGDVLVSVEGVIGSGAADNLTGSASDNLLSGLAGDDTLTGGGGGDTLTGGAGFDVASYANAAAGVVVRLDTGLGYSGDAAGDVLTSIEGLAGSAQNDTLIGNADANLLVGNAGNDDLRGYDGNDTLEGGAGADTLRGGNGFDTANYAASVAGVSVRLDTGVGAGGEAAGDVLTSIEALTGSAAADALTGGAGGNLLSGEAGDDTLQGGAGADTLRGGDGIDVASYASASTSVVVRLDTGLGYSGDAAGDTLTSIEGLTGSAQSDTLIGNAEANVLAGGGSGDDLRGYDGDDTLTGGAGADTLRGAGGTDTASYASASTSVVVRLDTGLGFGGDAAGDTLTSIENLVGSAQSDTLIGNAGANVLTGEGSGDDLRGYDGDDTLTGGAGADTLQGAGGTDTASYASASTSVVVRLDTGLGFGGDAAGDTLTSIENLIGSAQSDTLIGNAGANVLAGGGSGDDLRGNDGNDTLEGGAGADTLRGGNDFDLASYAGAPSGVVVRLDTGLGYSGEAAGDVLTSVEGLSGTGQNDILIGNAMANLLRGNAGNDDLRGYDGNDTLEGGAGNDTLAGGTGDDRFVFGDGTGADLIRDFAGGVGAGDVIDFTANGALNNFAQVQAAASQVGADTEIALGGGSILTLDAFIVGNLAADDFVF